MDRARRVASLWDALPVFRVVAETQSLTAAAHRVGRTPSAVSRRLSDLEKSVGHPLFQREGRRISLNEAGKRLLLATRDAMRMVDEALGAVRSEAIGVVRIAAEEPFTTLRLPNLLRALRAEHPGIVPYIVPPPADVDAALLDGSIDIAFVCRTTYRKPLRALSVATFETALFAKQSHPLLTPGADATDLQGYSFVSVEGIGAETPRPADWSCLDALLVSDYGVALSACSELSLLAVLPVELVATAGCELVRITGFPTSPLRVSAWTRKPVLGFSLADMVIAIVAKEVPATAAI